MIHVTKFDIGQTVWFVGPDFKVHSGQIVSVLISLSSPPQYTISTPTNPWQKRCVRWERSLRFTESAAIAVLRKPILECQPAGRHHLTRS